MTTAYLEGGPAHAHVRTLKNETARVLMLVEKDPEDQDVWYLRRYERTTQRLGEHIIFAYYPGDGQ